MSSIFIMIGIMIGCTALGLFIDNGLCEIAKSVRDLKEEKQLFKIKWDKNVEVKK